MKQVLYIMVVLTLLCQPVLAGTDYNICFSRIDSDVSGEMTQNEFTEAFPDGDPAVFEVADGDKNGVVEHEEWEEFKSSQGFKENHEG